MPNLAVPELDEHEWALTGSVDDMIAKVDGLRGNVTKDRLDEGIVWYCASPRSPWPTPGSREVLPPMRSGI